jgi:hypothetical protein
MRWMLRRVRMESRSGRRLVEEGNTLKKKKRMPWYGTVRYSIEDMVWLVCFSANLIPKKTFCKNAHAAFGTTRLRDHSCLSPQG